MKNHSSKKCSRLVLAAAASGSGKTVITCGLLRALQKRGRYPVAFKCGPDYIDPMFHKYVLRISGGNLDTYFLGYQELKKLFFQASAVGDISLIEGVMGYYDGIGGNTTKASTYEVAETLEAPVILIVNGKGASLSLAALVKGFVEYREPSRIAGVILNRVSEAVYRTVRPVIEKTGVEVLGFIPECEECRLESRHLGLLMPEETEDLRERIEALAARLEDTLDISRLLELADGAKDLVTPEDPGDEWSEAPQYSVRLAVARDQAFCFYYQENLELLEKFGAEIVWFSPLKDKTLPKRADGLLLGGGYPERFAKELSQNKSILEDIRNRISQGLPALAECGGFLYLHEELEGTDGRLYPMAGVIRSKAWNGKKLSRFGYISLKPLEMSAFLEKGEEIRAHEFHYWESQDPGGSFIAEKPSGNRRWECMVEQGALLCGFPHLYYPSNPSLAERFLSKCLEFQKCNGDEV